MGFRFLTKFPQAYASEMDKLVKELNLIVPRPTVSVAVVICKSKHPYKLAHEVGEARLKDAKHTGKRIKWRKISPIPQLILKWFLEEG